MRINIALKAVAIIVIIVAVVSLLTGQILLRNWEQTYSRSVEGQIEAFALPLTLELQRLESQDSPESFAIQKFAEPLSALCQHMLESQVGQKLSLADLSVVMENGIIVANARREMIGQRIPDSKVRFELGWQKTIVIQNGSMTHILYPLFGTTDKPLATLDIVMPDAHAQHRAAFIQARNRVISIFAAMLAAIALLAYPLFFLMVTKPIAYLAKVGYSIKEGRFLESTRLEKRRDELGYLAKTLIEISTYFQEMTRLTQQIASGALEGQHAEKRSKRDVLGIALQEMLAYLQSVAEGAKRIAEGDVRTFMPLRADRDALGRALHQMMDYLNEMADTAAMISTGDLRSNVTPRSERDVLGIAFANMTAYLRTLADSAAAIADGDLQQRIQPQSDYDVLGNAFARMEQQLRESFDNIRQEMAERIRAQEALQRLNEELEARVEERTAEIARQKYILDAFMANVPDNIYFKDRASAFTRINHALAALLGVEQPDEVIGKSDFDFFPEHQARPKYEQEQEIIRTGQPLLSLEEPDAQGRWALTTKMPLKDERGEIIGTFGISRDITPLKIAQQQVEEAYDKIQMLNEQLHQENKRMGAELEVARRLQQMVLPMRQELTAIPGLDMVGYMQPAAEVGGDYYDVLAYEQGHLCIGIGDVTGHGLESGVLMLMTQTAIRALVDRGETDPVIFLSTLNRVLYQNIQRMGVDRSLTLIVADYQQGQIRLSGQHEEALVARRDGLIERIDTINLGFPLGMVDDIQQWIAETTITLGPGDGIVFYTDGITEAQNAEKMLYGLERLCAVISANWRDATAEAVKEAIVEDVRRFVGSAPVHDDITLVVLKQQNM